MRLRRLDLTRYGCFTDFRVDFGERVPSVPDLHVIYGANESGKSTLLAAFLDLLYKIPNRSPYDFLHDYRSMRVGALLEISGRTQEFARIKRNNDSLLGPHDQPLPEPALSTAIGSIDRTSYTAMFSLDDDTLQSGGESILQSQGDLGKLLFSATSGLSRLSRKLDEIKAEVDAFHRRGRHATELKRLKERLAELKVRRDALDINVRHYNELREKADAARQAYETARSERDRIRIRHDQVRRLVDALPMWANLKHLRENLEPLEGVPDAPAGWVEEANRLSREQASARAGVSGAEEDLARLDRELGAIEVDSVILELREQLDRLGDEQVRDRGAALDIPVRQGELDAVTGQIAGYVKRLGHAPDIDPTELLLPAATLGALHDLIERRSAREERHDAAKREQEAARDRLRQAEESVEALGVAADASALEATLSSIRSRELGARLDQARQRQAELTVEIEADLTGLEPWHGDVEALAETVVPERGKIDRWQSGLADAHVNQAALAQKEAELAEAHARHIVEIRTVKASTGAVDDEEAEAARSNRNLAWQVHRDRLNAGTTDPGSFDPQALQSTADVFEAAMFENDRVADLRVGQSSDIARLRSAREEVARLEASLAHVRQQAEAASRRQEEVTGAIAADLRHAGLPEDMELADFERWCEQRNTVLKKRPRLKDAETKLRDLRDAETGARSALVKALSDFGAAPESDLPLSHLLDLAQTEVGRARNRGGAVAAAREARESTELELRRRERDAAEAKRAMHAWQEEWSALLGRCWLGAGGVERSSVEVREILKVLSELPALIEKRDDLGYRIRAMGDDRARFLETVRTLAAKAGLEFVEERVLDIASELDRRLEEALQETKLKESKKEDRERAQSRLRAAEKAITEINARVAEMGARFAVDTLSDLLDKLEQAKAKGSLVGQVATREQELVEGLKLSSLDAAEAALADAAGNEAGIEALHTELVEIENRVKLEDERVTRLYHESMTASDALVAVGGDADAARIEEERRTVLLQTWEQTERYLRLKVGVAAAERAIEMYRDHHRSSMMTRAGDGFRTMTRGRFSDLTTTPGKEGDVLVGIRSHGGSLLASEMSKGTRYQLYLALRIAGYHEFAERNETLPFVADDIMETFDDDRSAEAFQLLSGIAEKGQVIYLTHHAHMRDIALKVCGDKVQVHELPAPMGTASAEEALAGFGTAE